MRAGILEFRKWSKFETFMAFFLFVIIVSEIVVFLLLGQEAGEILSKAFASWSAAGIRALTQLWKWTYKMVGPMLFPLLALTTIEVLAMAKLVKCWRLGCRIEDSQKHYKTLGIVESVAPGFGFLGTCISLIFTMRNLDPSLTQATMLKVFIDSSSSAFGSTVYGISLAILAYISSKIFEELMFKPEQHKEFSSDRKSNVFEM